MTHFEIDECIWATQICGFTLGSNPHPLDRLTPVYIKYLQPYSSIRAKFFKLIYNEGQSYIDFYYGMDTKRIHSTKEFYSVLEHYLDSTNAF